MNDIIEYFDLCVKRNPSQIAIIDGGMRYTYLQLQERCKQYSGYLNKFKQAPKVLLDLNQGYDAYAMILACFNCNAIFCPLNPESPLERKLTIVSKLKPDLVIVEKDSSLCDQNLSCTVMSIGNINGNDPIELKTMLRDIDDLSYIIFTSGSSGDPKGVLISRIGVNKFIEWSISCYKVTEKDVWGQFSLLSFDLSIVDILTCLCSGGTLVSINTLVDKIKPANCIEQNKITIWHSIPSAVDFMIKGERNRNYDYSSLRLMSFCGEPLRKNHVEFLFKKNSAVKIFNTYGPTEGTLFCSWQEIDSSNYLEFTTSTVSIGKPIPGWNFKFSEHEGVTGKEIIIYGDYIGKGYLALPNNAKFGMVIASNDKKYESFETGDIVVSENDKLYFSGRIDRQVKIKGYRIELEEIDYWVQKCAGVNSFTVVMNNFLHTFIESETVFITVSLEECLRQNLEPFKIPNSFSFVKEFPRNLNLKVNIAALINSYEYEKDTY